ncbi:hypothetical protein [Bosea sp. CS1GBMeth4]|uniref:hypothetical protein n=1 Tax=Bosea sp. CS1GBMeth4 TaxID=1892849 RepID=UPI001648B717|nr:hypothetical protein [Bosea sp. CS1GBMeth4]
MTDLALIAASIATLALSVWLAFENSAALALPLVIVFAGLVRTLVRRSARRGITPAEIRPPSHEDTRS